MELKYGYKETYKFELTKEQLFVLSKYNRSTSQSQFLYQLVNGDFEKLKQLEDKIKSLHLSYCPSTQSEVEDVFSK